MSLFDELMNALPELTSEDFATESGTILLQDDSDGLGAYIAKWDYDQPIPDGFKLGK
jgi:hypothetical protein